MHGCSFPSCEDRHFSTFWSFFVTKMLIWGGETWRPRAVIGQNICTSFLKCWKKFKKIIRVALRWSSRTFSTSIIHDSPVKLEFYYAHHYSSFFVLIDWEGHVIWYHHRYNVFYWRFFEQKKFGKTSSKFFRFYSFLK